MKYIRFVVEGNPVGKQRPRFSWAGAEIWTYTPQKTKDYERLVQDNYYLQIGKKGVGYFEPQEPVFMLIDAVFRIPKGFTKADREKAVRGEILPLKRADVDNIAKVCMDALTGYAYHDDAQVVEVYCRKVYGENQRVVIRMSNEPLMEPKEVSE
jgi:Holliday junction resolvase RusA-like endonuclease